LQDLGLGSSFALQGQMPNSPSFANSDAKTLELSGDVAALPAYFHHLDAGRLNPVLGALEVRCDRLVRCTPKAVLDLRQWIQTLQSLGVRVSFQGVHRVVAAYFLSQGIYEYAKVVIRKD
jgi:hypothetical protein